MCQVFAHEDWEGRNNWVDNYRPEAGPDLVFDYPYAPKAQDSPDRLDEAKKYINATVTQLFYTTNMIHDLYYRYAFPMVPEIVLRTDGVLDTVSMKFLGTSSNTISVVEVLRTTLSSLMPKTVAVTTTPTL